MASDLREAIIAEARSYVGVPWRHLGRSRTGVDCLGLVIVVARATGLVADDFDFTGYGRLADGTMLRELRRYMYRINPRDALSGDVLAYRAATQPRHVGIVAAHGGVSTLVHAKAGHGVVLEQTLEQVAPGGHLAAAFRFPGVDDG